MKKPRGKPDSPPGKPDKPDKPPDPGTEPPVDISANAAIVYHLAIEAADALNAAVVYHARFEVGA